MSRTAIQRPSTKTFTPLQKNTSKQKTKNSSAPKGTTPIKENVPKNKKEKDPGTKNPFSGTPHHL